ncbi:S8 family serine peptidase [Phytohabitans aurantiacus]|uniref:Serine protease n=1 Tax=Phytohabitans aurantiacus TaxID=3016789 RepID=A0ABQ5QWQ4_9ACTN|nr:S8 family serine peptidase [Phytohabitans aurantiacus]GLH98076.1 serine protease [Phytohabitans aurantiacus]
MHLLRKIGTAMLSTGLVLGSAQAGWAAPDGAAPGGGAPPAAGIRGGTTVTLVTGDQVTVASGGRLAVRPAKDRADMKFAIHRDRSATYVIPRDALGLVRSGKVDRRLFDVTGLAKAGYDDAARDTVPLIVTFGKGVAKRGNSALAAAGAQIKQDLPAVGGAAVTARKDRASALWTALNTTGEVAKVWLDGKREVRLDQSVPQIGAPTAWASGYTGKGVTVAVLDTGVDLSHPDLAGKVAEARNFSEAEEDGDTIGHGTHVASIIAGSGAASGGKYKGVAPDARLVSGKVCESFGCTESAILAGMQWAAADMDATVINMSLGGGDTPEIDPLEEAVNTLTAQYGALFAIAAGNSGSGDGTIESPGSADAALTVGAVDKSDELADFSSRGPRIGDDALKPDITAPGVDIVAAKGAGTDIGDPVGTAYTSLSGTSMATPHVAGAVALLAQVHPDWTAGQLKAALTASAKPNPALSGYQQGAGRVDVARAITQTVSTDPVGVSFGRPYWPHGDDEPIVRTATYRNSGSAAVTLDLALNVRGPEGVAPPAGMFTLSANQVTVPAGGEAKVTITANTALGGPDGLYSGQLVATGGGTQVSTAVGVNKEVESYNLTVSHVDQTGAATGDYFTLLLGIDVPSWSDVYDDDGTATVRVPKGTYNLSTMIFKERGEEEVDASFQVRPTVKLTGDMTIAFDARTGKPVVSTVPERSARPALVDVSFTHFAEEGSFGVGLFTNDFEGLTTRHIGATLTANEFVSYVASQWAKPGPDGNFLDSPYFYGVSEGIPGKMPNGYTRHYKARELATVRHKFEPSAAGPVAERAVFPMLEWNTGAGAIVLPVDLPSQRVEYHNTQGVRWESSLGIGTWNEEEEWIDVRAYLFHPPKPFSAGKEYRDQWNVAPYGPVLPAGSQFPFLGRYGDELFIDVALYGDRAGHGGYSLTDTSRTALYRNGELVGETECSACGAFEVPAGRANYRFEVADTRSFMDLTTAVSAAWTFKSAHVSGEEPASLPISVMRFAPKLDANGGAPSGGTFQIPVTVERGPGTPGTARLAVEVSYDDGKTWSTAKLRKAGAGWVATVSHPSGAGFVSLRAKATDTGGNTVTQTIVHAYRLS